MINTSSDSAHRLSPPSSPGRTPRLGALAALGVLCASAVPCHAAEGGRFHFQIGLTYAQGVVDAGDALTELYEARGYTVDSLVIPVGLTLDPYYELSSGIGFGLSMGPFAAIGVDEVGFGSASSDLSFVLPMGGFLRYTLWADRDFAVYVKAGIRYPICIGDQVEAGDPGPFGGVGIDLWRTKSVGMAIEFGYDASEIRVLSGNMSKDVTFPGFMGTLAVRF